MPASAPSHVRADAIPRRSVVRMAMSVTSGKRPATSAKRSMRSLSAKNTFAPESSRPYAISSGVQSEFIATAMPPTEVVAMNARIHSG